MKQQRINLKNGYNFFKNPENNKCCYDVKKLELLYNVNKIANSMVTKENNLAVP